jgi:phosphonate transport system substrate-binding protein
LKLSRRSLLLLLGLAGCGVGSQPRQGGRQLVIGTVSYGAGEDSIKRYDRFKRYLEEKMQAVVQVEPSYNEAKALERIRTQAWSIVFAPPGLAVIATTQHQYTPILPLEGLNNLRSIIVVKQDSPYENLTSLTGKPFAIGQVGSATGYYFPIFNLYGITLSELILAPTPKAVLEAIAEGKAQAGALSMEEFKTFRSQVSGTTFRILFTDSHQVPSGVVLISPKIDTLERESIHRIMGNTPSQLADEAGFVPTASVTDYKYMVSVVKRVQSIFPVDNTQGGMNLLTQKPIRLFQDGAKSGLEPLPTPSLEVSPTPSLSPTPTSTPTPTSSPLPSDSPVAAPSP